jgi:crotonobetainyl-CoA:carnitine CoA-transferase CaiB-like acyl-CoA transferase
MNRYFTSMYTDGPSTRWNVIDRKTQEWVRRFSTEQEAQEYAAKLELKAKQYLTPKEVLERLAPGLAKRAK